MIKITANGEIYLKKIYEISKYTPRIKGRNKICKASFLSTKPTKNAVIKAEIGINKFCIKKSKISKKLFPKKFKFGALT